VPVGVTAASAAAGATPTETWLVIVSYLTVSEPWRLKPKRNPVFAGVQKRG
jgi:hypothetical protein